MDSDEEALEDFLSQTDDQIQEFSDDVINDLKNILRESIENNVYNYYSPSVYQRKYNLLDNIEAKLDNDGNLYVYIGTENISNSAYWSTVSGQYQSPEQVASWVEHGHHMSNTTVDNEFTNYEARMYLENAVEQVQQKYPDFHIELISDVNFII